MSFFVGAFVGFRSWKVKDGKLHSAVMPAGWLADEPTKAYCINTHKLCDGSEIPHRGVCPHPRCTCGLHGWHDLNMALRTYVLHKDTVVGSAVFWGRMQIHTDGLRAEFARPIAFVEERQGRTTRPRDADFSQCLNAMAETYQLPVLPLEDLVDYTSTFGDAIGNQID